MRPKFRMMELECSIDMILLYIDIKVEDSITTRRNFTFGVDGRSKKKAVGVGYDELLVIVRNIQPSLGSSLQGGRHSGVASGGRESIESRSESQRDRGLSERCLLSQEKEANEGWRDAKSFELVVAAKSEANGQTLETDQWLDLNETYQANTLVYRGERRKRYRNPNHSLKTFTLEINNITHHSGQIQSFTSTMPSFAFADLPTEMRKKVVLHALPSVTVPFRYLHSNIAWVHDHHEEQAIKALLETNVDVASLVNQVRCLKAVGYDGSSIMSSIGGVPFRIDPLHDIFQVVDMRLPAVRPSAAWDPRSQGHHRHALPVENILSVSRTVWLRRGEAPPDNNDQGDGDGHGSDEAGPSDAPPSTYYEMPFESDLPIFSRLPKAKKLALIVENVGKEWHIDGFQMFGPDIVGPRFQGNDWGMRRAGHHSIEGQNYFWNRGIRADTRIPWTFPNGWDYLSNSEDVSQYSPNDARFCPPNIGFYGYSRGNVSLGGQWAGFRLWVDENKVEFSPLSWWEVEPLIDEYYSIEERGYRTCHPGFVARIWVIRSEKDLQPTNQPHHHWMEVREAEIGDPEWVEQVSTTWKMVRDMLSRVRGDTSVEDDNDLNLAEGNYCLQMEPID
ncbi:hypothetical protein F52700_5882 [Fusarium sp. NRRL 52700]|nr:hypothetical protein F52700_5882 [Fusarium sp. NRRL 52700]